jgi:hypothetical protein
MAVKYSTGLRDKMNGLKATVKGAIIGATLAFVDGGLGVADTITDSGNGFVTAKFAPGDVLFVKGATTAANDSALTGVVITSVAEGVLTLPTASVHTAQVAPAGCVVAVAAGGSLKDIMKDGKLLFYTGTVPSSADAGVGTSTLLLTITQDSGAFVAGAFGNGLEFENDPTDGVMEKASGETWSGVAVASGVIGWFMWVGNPTDALGSSNVLPRIIGSCGLSNADLIVPNTSIVSGRTYTLDEVTLTLPAYYGA